MSTFDLTRIGAGLAAARAVGTLGDALAGTGACVVQAPPGTGKTTLVPPALANITGGKVVVTAPRRVAVRAAARRLAHLDGSRLGDRVGFTVRGEHHAGSRVQFVTPGVLLRRLLADPELAGVDAVALDEVHERQLDTDLLVGMLTELHQLRDDLVLTAMSATIDADTFAGLIGGPVVSTEAVTHPLDVRYIPGGTRLGARGVEWAFLDHMARVAVDAVAELGHSALVFVPGAREVDRVVSTIQGLAPGVPVLPLHGQLAAAAQDAALTPADRPRIVVATSIAESSLTVPGVRIVVDSGLARVPRRDASRGMTGLVTTTCAASSADQRAGRAGREGPGTVLRCYEPRVYSTMQPHITPEIATSDLTQAALQLTCWGTPRGVGLPLVDAPPTTAITEAEQVLRRLGTVNADGAVTPFGRRLAGIPASPRLARALLLTVPLLGERAARTVALLADQPRGDVAAQARAERGRLGREAARLMRLARGAEAESDYPTTHPEGLVTALAYPEQVARRTGGDWLLASGTRATLPGGTGLDDAEWLAVAEVTRTTAREGRTGAVIRAAARLDEETALAVVGVSETVTATLEGGRIRARKVRSAGAIELSSTPTSVDKRHASEAIAEGLRTDGLGVFTFSAAANDLRHRLAWLHTHVGDPWPSVAEGELLANLDAWLAPDLERIARGTPPGTIDMHAALRRLLPWPEAAQMNELVPQRLTVPSGNSHAIDYSGEKPVVACKLQECFGLAESPRITGVPVLFHLLSPAGRPLAVTDDLASFWSGPYSGVRADMRGRYPKHPWPEDPWTATATARTKRRM
ncbi:ATP-dependent helicase HrpB [Corynebacterium sp. CCM 9204]|uniref:ATP-dependent helicase HrpB n=1 Tax=Corynebacterium sp. CCM 9204 TaxID=3057616 RepID=UPI003526A5C3